MTPAHHTLTESGFTALARGGGGADVMRTLVAARRSRTLLLLRYLLGETSENTPTRQAFAVLAEVRRAAPAAVAATLDHPLIGAWVTRTATSLREGRPAQTAALGRVALAAAIRGRVETTVTLPPAPATGHHLPSLGTVTRSCGTTIPVRCAEDMTILADVVRIPANWWRPGSGWRPTPVITTRGARFLLERWPQEHLPAGLHAADEIDESRWRDMISSGWDLLARRHSDVAGELAVAIPVLAPLRAVSTGMTSATLDDAFGAVFMSPAPNAATVAVTLVHELQHAKLTALMEMFDLLEPAAGERFYAPWRDDPRPLVGLLHGVYAFAGVAGFWRRQRMTTASIAEEQHATNEFARWRTATRTAAATVLDSGRLTSLGVTFMTNLTSTLDKWCNERVPVEAQRRAERLLDDHRARWLLTHTA